MQPEQLQAENAELRLRLEEAEETLRAIQSGAVDAFVVNGDSGHRVYTLEAADRPYRLFVERMQQGAVTLHNSGVIGYCNQALAQLLATPIEDLIGKDLHDFVARDDRKLFAGLMQQASRESGTVEVRLRRSDRKRVPVLLTSNPLPSDAGAVIGVLVTDLAGQRRQEHLAAANQALRISEERFRLMADAVPVLIWVSDLTMGCTWFNRSWTTFSGRSLEELLGDGWERDVHPDDLDRCMDVYVTHFKAREAFCMEYRLRRHDGEYRWVQDDGTPRFEVDGTFAGYIGSCVDFTDRQRAEEAMRSSEERFRMLADNMAQLAWTCEQLGEVNWYNQRWLDYTGYSFEQMRDWGWKKVQHPDHVERVVAGVNRSRESGQIWEDTFPLRGKDGQYRWFLSRAVPIRDDAGRIVRWFGTNTDVTERIVMEESLKQGDRRKDEFLAILAHELRNPLAPIRNALHIMRKVAQPDPTFAQISAMMERQVNQMVRLVDDLMEVSRITRGKIELRHEPTPVASIVRSAVETSQPLIEAAGHTLELDVPDNSLRVVGDVVRLAQVLANLLNNAAKYTDPGGTIRLSAHREANVVTLRVRDNGTGIDAAMLPHVFDLFTQADQRIERAQGGLGIGLALVKSLVEMHDGSVQAHSAGKGLGSEFVVRLPLAMGIEDGDPARKDAPQWNVDGCRVLVVDDNQDAADSLGMLLQLMGAEVTTVYSGAAAIEQFARTRPSIVVLDIGMPGMDGHEVARRIRREANGADAVLIAMTGWGQERDRALTQLAGFDYHLVKPADLASLQRIFLSTQRRRI